MTIDAWLSDATEQLVDSGSQSARLDAEIILAHTIGHPRTWLHAHPDEEIDVRHEEIADARLDLRLDHVPIAYIIGHKEFYSRRFALTPHVLVPRPESEQLIELLDTSLAQQSLFAVPHATTRLVDVGCGSGCLGITAKLEHPELDVSLIDRSSAALSVSEKNAAALGATVQIMKSDLLLDYPFEPDIILANLPYVDPDWPRSEETKHEPPEALFAERNGLGLIDKLIVQAAARLRPGGMLILEADPRQWADITAHALAAGFSQTAESRFGRVYQKTTV